jgi:tetratricopeptide (TPR) repeat protein
VLSRPVTVTLRGGLTADQEDIGGYWIDLIAGSRDLVITFENAGLPNARDALRDGWGLSFLHKRGATVLAVKWKVADWYRSSEIHEFFRSSRFAAFVAQFDRVTFIGGSMGGYAALVFSETVPGALVIAHNPQTTLDERIVPWERRFDFGRRQNWDGDFADAGATALRARRIYVTYDPFDADDRRHVERLQGGNIVALKMPFLGHRTPEWLREMKILSRVTAQAMDETLSAPAFAGMARARRNIAQYYLGLYKRTRKPGFKNLVLERGLKLFPFHAGLLFFRLIQQFNLGLYDGCVAAFRSLPEGELPASRQGEARAYAGQALYRLGRADEARALAARVNESSKNAAELLISSRFLNAIGDHARAGVLARAAVAQAPFQSGGYVQWAMSSMAQGQRDEALAVLAAAAEKIGRADAAIRTLRQDMEKP